MPQSLVPEQAAIDVLLESGASHQMWQEHDRLQRSFLSCSSYLEAHELIGRAQIAKLVSEGATKCSVAFRIANHSASVIGSLTSSAQEFLLIANRLLDAYPDIHYVRSELLVRDVEVESDPRVVIVRQADDMNRELPPTVEEFERSLGKKRLKDIRYHERHFRRHFPSAEIVMKCGDEITPALFHSVVELHRARMKAKGRTSGVHDLEEKRMLQVAVTSGFLVLLMNGDDLAAGLVAFTTASDGYFWMIAHDSRYDNFGPGITCLYGGFKYMISAGVQQMHFLWGDSNYKRLFGTEPTRTAAYVVLRPGVHKWSILPLLCSYYRENTFSWITRQAAENPGLVRLYRKLRTGRALSGRSLRPDRSKTKEAPPECAEL